MNLFLQYVVVPTRRGTAEALQILISHLLGDAGSPYLIGVVSFISVYSSKIIEKLLNWKLLGSRIVQ